MSRVSKKKSSYSGPVDSPEGRVEAFISHWHEQWSKALKKMGEDVDFDYWHGQISEVDATHFIVGKNSGSRNHFSSGADYDPKCDKIIECVNKGDITQVTTEKYDDGLNLSKYRVYELVRDVEGGWKISEMYRLLDPPNSPVIDADRLRELLAMSVEDVRYGEGYLDLDENTLFQKERSISIPNLGKGVARLERIGKLRIRSGVIGILDFGYGIYNFEPLHRKIKPGDYPVEIVTIHNRVAGIRVKLTRGKARRWHAAKTPSGYWVYGVDAGNLAIFDVGNLMGLSRLDKEKLYGEWSSSGKTKLVSMTSKDDCVITSSGFGDGTYPAYWGVSKNKEVVSLYIDFMILVKQNEDGIYESI